MVRASDNVDVSNARQSKRRLFFNGFRNVANVLSIIALREVL